MNRIHRAIIKKERKPLGETVSEMRENPLFRKVGAIGTFVGVVRGESLEGNRVIGLELEAYEEKADEVLEEICRDLRVREGIIDVQIYHFLGDFTVGEELVHVVVAGSHREEVFETLELAVERYKREAPIFKKELVIDEETRKQRGYWIKEKS